MHERRGYEALFFFSSRRRHTRLVSDWSSDVCSSDLGEAHGLFRYLSASPGRGHSNDTSRSEERRVGKEGRTRGAPDDEKKKRSEIEEIGAGLEQMKRSSGRCCKRRRDRSPGDSGRRR